MITELPVLIEAPDGSATWGAAATDHPMRAVTRAVAFDPDGWTPARQAEVIELFDSLAPEWNDRHVPERELPMHDALDRGLAAAPPVPRHLAVELGGGTGLYAEQLAQHFGALVTLDIATEMVLRMPVGAAQRVQGDGSSLPLADGSVDALVLINMFLFPAEAARVLSPHGVVVWINSRGAETPIHLTAQEVDQALPGAWTGVASAAGFGTWSVHWRDS